eukprot:1901474-Pyramimonas_sp.AAC.1
MPARQASCCAAFARLLRTIKSFAERAPSKPDASKVQRVPHSNVSRVSNECVLQHAGSEPPSN